MSTDRSQPIGIQLCNIAHFHSIGRTGTGSLETIPHGLGVTPIYVGVQARTSSNTVTLSATPADATNIYVTVANAAVYDIVAICGGE